MERRKFLKRAALAPILGAGVLQMLAGCKLFGAKFKLGACDWSMGFKGELEALSAAKKIGLDGVQISPKGTNPAELFMDQELIAAYKAKCIETNVSIASVATTCLSKNPFTYNEDAMRYLKEAIDTSDALRSENILMPFFGPADMQDKETKRLDEKHFAPLVAKLKQVAPYAKEKSVVVCLENSLSADENKRIIDAVGSDYIKIYLDIFNCEFYSHNTLETIKGLKGGYIGQIHLKEGGHKLDANSGMPKNLPACLDAIWDSGYDGWLVLETHGYDSKKFGPVLDTLKYNADYMRKTKFFK